MHGKRPLDLAELERRASAAPPVKIESLWVLDDGRAGSRARCLGIAEMLGFADPEVITIRSKFKGRWLDWLPVSWVFEDLPQGGYPQVVVGAGARPSRVLRWMKQRAPEILAVQIMRPARGLGSFDVVVMEAHDNPPKRPNVCVTTGAVNRVSATRLAQEAQRWQSRLQEYRKPLAVVVGGSSKHSTFGEVEAKQLARDVLKAAKAAKMSLLVSTSRRTGEAVTAVLRKMLTGQEEVPVYFWEPENVARRDNPYFAYLALAEAVVVTGDSVSMISEAATAAKPVYVWGSLAKLPGKFRRFIETLCVQGRARLWDGNLTLPKPAAGLMDTMMAAGFVRAKLRERAKGQKG